MNWDPYFYLPAVTRDQFFSKMEKSEVVLAGIKPRSYRLKPSNIPDAMIMLYMFYIITLWPASYQLHHRDNFTAQWMMEYVLVFSWWLVDIVLDKIDLITN